jgi:hypothetical protein
LLCIKTQVLEEQEESGSDGKKDKEKAYFQELSHYLVQQSNTIHCRWPSFLPSSSLLFTQKTGHSLACQHFHEPYVAEINIWYEEHFSTGIDDATPCVRNSYNFRHDCEPLLKLFMNNIILQHPVALCRSGFVYFSAYVQFWLLLISLYCKNTLHVSG